MGMYTELVLNCKIKKDTPQNVIDILLGMFEDGHDEPDILPEHEFFSCKRWASVGSCSGFYFVPFKLSSMQKLIDNYYISTRSDLKNYDGEIEKFIDWLMPYIDGYEGKFLGYIRYEEDDAPTLINKIVGRLI